MEPSVSPRWNLECVYPSLDSPEFVEARRAMEQDLDRLCNRFDALQVDPGKARSADRLEAVLCEVNAFLESSRTVTAFVSLHVAADSRNARAQSELSELSRTQSKLTKLMVRLTGWLKDADVDHLSDASEFLREYRHFLSRLRMLADRLMTHAEEELYAELQPSGAIAWGKLHGNLTSTLQAEVELASSSRRLSMSQVRNLAFSPDRAVRRAAYEAELRAWRSVETPLAASLNSIKGEVLVVCRRRGWAGPLDEALFAAGIDQPVLDAMIGAARASFPIFRRYLRAKARILGLERLAWFDLFAPVGKEVEWSFAEAERFILERFEEYSPRLQEMAGRAFSERWIDAEPRIGKRDGAFCAPLRRDESRILMNFKPSFGSVSTLAHELGHAYHNLCLSQRAPLLRTTPMTLAETASIFCETLVRHAALSQVEGSQRLSLLEASLQGACQTVIDITSRFLFEQEVFRGRESREWNASELCELMLRCQEDTYGEGLTRDALHPYMWAVKPHYYSAARSFYNFPYLFGHLFGLGLYQKYREDPDGFRSRYDELLSSTGVAPAFELADRFGIQLRSPGFWESSLSIVEQEVVEFERMVDELGPC